MKLKHEFIQLPVRFDVAELQREVEAIPQDRWRAHHEGFKGNYSVPLISVEGKDNNEFKGPMAPTDILHRSPYLKQVISSFGEVIGRSRLMALDSGAEVPVHSDINYHWYKRVRIHVPITTTPDVRFHCGDKEVNMQAGDAWIFDSWKYHTVKNNSDVFRVHLVIDICGSSRFWELTERGNVPWLDPVSDDADFRFIAPHTDTDPAIRTETFNTPLVMTPGEMDGMAQELFAELHQGKGNAQQDVSAFIQRVEQFCQDWRVLWAQYGMSEAGWPHYHLLRETAYASVREYENRLTLGNGTQAPRMYLFCMIDPALNVEVAGQFATINANQADPGGAQPAGAQRDAVPEPHSRNAPCPCGSGQRYKTCHGKLA
ncbi:aspartyl/asparaginyl beta-hydroxylase domain-containing protein [Alteromonas halophila]|uniref:Aspartyl/asparaginy/proline hydroxylase domain-containing protein n=1 Tax=Alteromonas halophila TaxID=516698 RepID=A0A918JCC6_9ALTE|nr:aspartyl/asparaginyl beta-hydroxylase domain-containing protein [Alteromonas halophila]GGW74039.1 hypothetical protein GCM10007391_02270 [Alteromonas halophila]